MINLAQLLDKADLMAATQQYDNALATCNQIISEKNNCDEAYLLRGELYGKLGQYEKAFEDIEKAISIDPDYDESYMILAQLYLKKNEPEKAIELYQKAAALNNKTAKNQIIQLAEKLADQQLANHQADKAVSNYKLALQYRKDDINLMYKHAFAVSRTGDFETAFILIDEILSLNANHLPTKSLLISTYEKTGQQKKGWQLIKTLAEAYPDNAYINITFGKYALQNNKQTEAIERLKRIDKQYGLKVDDKLSINMLLGKLYDSIRDYKNAFLYFQTANNLKYNEYDINDFEREVSNIINFYSINKYNRLPASNNNSTDCIFILGMPRSGTSLIEQIISSHSEVYGGGELNTVPRIIHTISNTGSGNSFPNVLDGIDKDKIEHYASELLNSLKSVSPGVQKITDKLPHNFLFIGFIHKLLPNAKIINCVRNPVDNCLSCYFQHFGGYHPYAYNLSHLGKYYQQYQRLMYHWETTLNIPVLNVSYEDVVNDTKSQIERILNYIGLPWEDQCLDFYKQKRMINTASYTQVTKKIYSHSINRWVNYKPYIKELLDLPEML